ncbi:phosphatidate cytidylyltransferase 4, chloroplastic-like [Musa acuminata AAA Group]
MAATAAAFLEVDRCGLFSLPLSLSPRSFLLPRRQLPGLRLFLPSRRFYPCRLSAALVSSRKAASKSDSHREDSLEGVEAVVVEPKGSQGMQLRKRVIFGLGIGLGAGGVVVAGGWVFTVALGGRSVRRGEGVLRAGPESGN